MLKRKRRTSKATKKQVMALELINQGVVPKEAMLRAGYSKNVASNPGNKLFKAKAIIDIVEQMKEQLVSKDITAAYLAERIKKMLVAEKDDPDDYRTQEAALKLSLDIMGLKKENSNLKRKVTLEEFIGGESMNQTSSLVEELEPVDTVTSATSEEYE